MVAPKCLETHIDVSCDHILKQEGEKAMSARLVLTCRDRHSTKDDTQGACNPPELRASPPKILSTGILETSGTYST